MINKDNFKNVLIALGFVENGELYFKTFIDHDASLAVDFNEERIIYPEDKGFIVNERQTCNFSSRENFVVFECVNRLFEKGYIPNHFELEPRWQVGHGASGGRADIMIKDNSRKSLLIIECKTPGKEFDDEWKRTLVNGGQIFSYAKQAGSTQFVALYTCDFVDEVLVPQYYLITLKDNKSLLEEFKHKDPLSYGEAKLLDKEDIFRAWKNTYSLDYSTKGIFESDIPAYEIGKIKYSLADLYNISSNDIQGKYHEFATILRQHNVSGRENAFDKLVNLFLCKIVDETNNPGELKFYWKGIAYDSYFELQDRLQKLYKEGMKRFLGEEVTYIDNESIDRAFRFFKNDPDSTKETIKRYFRELKFFTNNDFAFIDVHNEKLFYHNSAVLLKIVQMLQDIRLKDEEEEHQFLGDMFEGFLDQGVKQTEGQFFTPMPLVKFILKSLPLEHITETSVEVPKVIDYACGAGHFLNEYAQEIKPIVKKQKETDIRKYYKQIVGVEKEYRLSKVAKVSAFMYGQDEINIVYADALSSIPEIENGEYSLLVANPPYSVKGFLETLKESDRKKFKLVDSVDPKSFSHNNSIEAFFVERAKQLLKPEGVAGIIVPSSILTKGKSKSTSKSSNIFVATREIILKYFEIIAIAEFGSGTFGKTGTNTVTLFLRRRKENPAPADHYKNRVEAWFKGDKAKNGVFEDEYLIKEYCKYLEINFDDFETLLVGNPSPQLMNTELLISYKNEFNKWNEIKILKNQKTFLALSAEEQEKELSKRYTNYVRDCEKDKLYYFVLAQINSQKVLIIKSPSKSSEIKKYLGYEWSSAKGKEGIKYLGTSKVKNDTESIVNSDYLDDIESDDKRVLENLRNLSNINTPLYDPKENMNPEKINYLILNNFYSEEIEIPESLQQNVSSAFLYEMLDLGRIDFNKSISLVPNIKLQITSKWDQVKLSSILTLEYGKNLPEDNRISGPYPVVGSNGIVGYHNEYLVKGPCIIVGRKGTAGKVTWVENNCYPIDTTFYVKLKDGSINYYYIYLILSRLGLESLIGRMGVPGLNRDDVYYQKIPKPKKRIQEIIADKCVEIEKAIQELNQKNISEKEEITAKFNQAHSMAVNSYKLSDEKIFEISIGQRVLKNDLKLSGDIPVISANVFKPFGHVTELLIDDFSRPSVLWGIDGDWMVNYIPKERRFYPTDHCGVIRVTKDEIHPRYLALVLQNVGEAERFSRHHRASVDRIKALEVKLPPKNIQDQLVIDIAECERSIEKNTSEMEGLQEKKEKVIMEYL